MEYSCAFSYYSFNYLTYIPVDKVKLDKSLNDQFISENNFGTIESLITLIHSLDLEVMAEGIEDDERKDKLIRGKCDYMQVYIFAKPWTIEELNKTYNKKIYNYFINRPSCFIRSVFIL